MSFLQAVEVWVPKGSYLLRGSSAYGSHDALAQLTPSAVLARGEGLAGAAFSTGRPKLHVGAPLETDGAPNIAVALPFFAGSTLLAVAVIWCRAEEAAGCVELWEPNQLRELVLADGYYGSLTSFERLSRVMRFQAGSGIPGQTWQHGLPMIAPDLGASTSFLRASAARELGIRCGLSLPIHRSGSVTNVALFLSVGATPLARAIEIWMPDATGHLHVSEALYEPGLEAFGRDNRSVEFVPGAGLVGKVFDTGVPLAIDRTSADAFTGHVGVHAAELRLAVGLPIHDGKRVRAVAVLMA